MNLNEMRANAYSKAFESGGKDSKNENSGAEGKVVKPFMPQKLTKADFVEKKETVKEKSAVEAGQANVKPAQFKNFKALGDKVDEIKNASSTPNSVRLENATDYLKTGGLIKVPVEEKLPDGSVMTKKRGPNGKMELVRTYPDGRERYYDMTGREIIR